MSTLLRPDILIQNPATGPVAIVEIRNRLDLPPEVAAEIYEMLSAYGYGVRAPYFLMVSQDRGFLWKVAYDRTAAAPPQEFEMRNVVARYLPDLGPTERLRGAELGLIVWHWLHDLSQREPDTDDEPEQTLTRLGFLAALHGATVTLEPEE